MSTNLPKSVVFAAITTLCLAGHLRAQSASGQRNAFDSRTEQQANDLINSRVSRNAIRDAEELLEATQTRGWSYVGTDGKSRQVYEAYAGVQLHGGEPWVVFQSRRRAPISSLGESEKRLIEKIGELVRRVASHHDDLVMMERAAVEQQHQQAQREQQLQEEIERQRIEQTTVPRLIVVQDFIAEMPTQNGVRPIVVSANEEFTALAEREGEVMISFYGDTVWVAKGNFAVIGRVPRPSGEPASRNSGMHQSQRPALPDVEPPQLDIRLEFDNINDGGLVRQVFRGGEGERMGIRAGDVIMQVNNRPVRTYNEAMTATRMGNGSIKLLVQRQNQMIVLSTASQKASGSLPFGVTQARPHRYGGLVVGDVDPNSIAGRLGIGRGDVIVSLNGIPMSSPESLIAHNQNPAGRYQIVLANTYGSGTRTLSWPN